jgi:hypothetical protein
MGGGERVRVVVGVKFRVPCWNSNVDVLDSFEALAGKDLRSG